MTEERIKKAPGKLMFLEHKRIFVIEDDLNNRFVYQMILINQGATFEFDRWGIGTVEKLEAFFPVHLIILDLMLPRGITGYDVYGQIRQEKLFDHVPIVAVSASNPATTIPTVRERGFSGFIPKPIDSQTFPKQLAQILNGEAAWFDQ